jgi:hypothetical protein
MKFATDRPYANPETAARKLIEIVNSVEANTFIYDSLKFTLDCRLLWAQSCHESASLCPDI